VTAPARRPVLPPRLAVIYVQHSPDRYPGALETLEGYLERFWYCQPYLLVVDNAAESTPYELVGPGRGFVGGDNGSREFSGWQRGLDVLAAQDVPWDMLLMTNEAFLAPGPSFLSRYPTLDDLLRWHRYGLAAGRVDFLPRRVSVLGRRISSWICTNAIFVPRSAIEAIGSVVSVTEEDLDRLLPSVCPRQISTTHTVRLSRAEAEAGARYEWPLGADGNVLVAIESAHPFVPRDIGFGSDARTLGLYVRQLKAGSRSLAEAVSTTGWYPDGKGGWTGPRFGATFAGVSGRLQLAVWVPPPMMATAPEHFEVVVTIVRDPFLAEAPISAEYRLLLLEWVSLRWRQQFALGPRTWVLFRDKVRAILNEAILSSRLTDAGFELVPYGSERFY